eukprot:scaffold612_cov98-Cylindrotheca_fusiformis.AAC.3
MSAPRRHHQLSRPPYVDPNTNIIYDTDNPEFQGYLTKQSMWLKDWRRRYFFLKGSKLFFGKNEYGGPHGMIDLAHCTTVKSADLKSKKRNSFEISTPEMTFLLYADTEQEKDDWIGRVGKAIVRCSSTYYNNKNNNNNNNNTGPYQQQQQQRQQQQQNPYYGMMTQQQLMQQQEEDSDDDDIYYEDPNNPNPYFND